MLDPYNSDSSTAVTVIEGANVAVGASAACDAAPRVAASGCSSPIRAPIIIRTMISPTRPPKAMPTHFRNLPKPEDRRCGTGCYTGVAAVGSIAAPQELQNLEPSVN